MIKLATITPINCITHQQDGEAFTVWWDSATGTLTGRFDSGAEELLEYTAETAEEAADIVYSLYASSNAWIYEGEELDA